MIFVTNMSFALSCLYLVEVLHGLDVVVGEVEPRQQVDVLQPLDRDQAVRREVKNLVGNFD